MVWTLHFESWTQKFLEAEIRPEFSIKLDFQLSTSNFEVEIVTGILVEKCKQKLLQKSRHRDCPLSLLTEGEHVRQSSQ